MINNITAVYIRGTFASLWVSTTFDTKCCQTVSSLGLSAHQCAVWGPEEKNTSGFGCGLYLHGVTCMTERVCSRLRLSIATETGINRCNTRPYSQTMVWMEYPTHLETDVSLLQLNLLKGFLIAALLAGWWAHFYTSKVQRKWSPLQRGLHINVPLQVLGFLEGKVLFRSVLLLIKIQSSTWYLI